MADESYKLDFIEARVPDLMNLVEVLNLVLGLHQAEDIAKCHRNLVDVRYSPLTKEVEATRDRFDGLVKDYWAEKGRKVAAEEMARAAGIEEEPEEEEDDLPEIPEDTVPLGSLKSEFKAPPMVFTEDDE